MGLEGTEGGDLGRWEGGKTPSELDGRGGLKSNDTSQNVPS